MKKFCLTCGEQILLPTRSDKKFCCAKCYRKYQRRSWAQATIKNSFKLFQAIVKNSETFDEFRELYNHYFGGSYYEK